MPLLSTILSLIMMLPAAVRAEPERVHDPGLLLERIEAVDHKIETYSATVMYQRFFAFQGDQQTRQGTLYYERKEGEAVPAGPPAPPGQQDQPRPPRPRIFAIDFDSIIVDGEQREEHQSFIFDGEFLVEKEIDEDGKRFVKRRIAAPGERIDPLKLGEEGMIPLPIGQRRDDILRRYDVELLGTSEGINTEEAPLLKLLGDAYQLKLVPREEFAEIERFTQIRLWYRSEDFHPIASLAQDRSGDEITVRLIGEANVPREPDRVDTSIPQEPGWEIRIDDPHAVQNAPQDE